ncbi:MAG: alpha-2-macroglobulin family protein [Rhodobacteraceae bacterium]|nr:alpha-2-macroglobulin family protein [Paracoccaceae bacterium]
MRRIVFALLSAVAVGLSCQPVPAQEGSYIPERRLVLSENVDLAGNDIRQIFDTTLEACEQACLADARCEALTFNARSNACFPKSRRGEPSFYQGAFSAQVIPAAPGAAALARKRASELAFLRPEDLDAAFAQAQGLANEHITGDWTAADLLAAADAAAADGDILGAAKFRGAALNLTDAADQWVEYGRLLLDAALQDSDRRQSLLDRALPAAVNAYLRADGPGTAASALVLMAQALEAADRGRDMIPALRLAQSAQPRDDTAALLDDAIGKYGFRIEETQVQSDSASPRICAVFNRDLVPAGVDYATFVRPDQPGLSVEAAGRQICIAGVEHGRRYSVTFREGLPSADGEVMARDVTLTQYVRDRAPGVRFAGRAYVLPGIEGAGIPVETVNTDRLDLTLLRISDRNLVRAMQADYFGRPLSYWEAQDLSGSMAETVWTGTAKVAVETNRDVTTRLPMADVLKDLGPGIYALQAAVPGRDPYDFPPAMQWFVISDLGLTTLTATDGIHVFVRSLADASARAGVTVSLVSRANAVVATASTDAQGYVRFDPSVTQVAGGGAPALVTVEDGDDFAFLSLTEPEFDLTDRGVAGREAAPPIDVFLSTDRGAYRAGETVNATILARDPRIDAIDGLPLTVRLLRPDGVEYSRVLASGAGAGGYTVSLPLGGGAPRGTWRIEAFVEETAVLAGQAFLVEDFLPERIDFALTMPEGPLAMGGTARIGVDARYLFGAPGAGLAVEGDLRLTAATTVEGFEGYVFGRHDEPFAGYGDSLPDAGPTDEAGRAVVPVVLPDLGALGNRPLQARFAVRLREGSGRPVERRITRTVLPSGPVIGIRPGFQGGTVREGGEAGFDLVALGPDGRPAALDVTWTINRLQTDYQWYSLYGNWNWEVTTTRTRVAGGDVSLSAAGPVRVSAPVDWGSYEIVVTARGAGSAVSSAGFYAGWYAPADAAASPDMLEMSLDRPAYRPGDTAQLRVVPRAAGVALVSVLSNRLIAMKAVPVGEGANLIDIPVTDDWGAGAYVTASVIRPMAAEAGRTPARAMGLAYAPVDPAARRLSVAIEAAPEAAPRGPLPVAVKVDGVAPGETAYVTLAAVDVGILNLTGFTAPDPEGHYFGQRRLGVGIRDIYGRLIDGRNGAMGEVRSGGDSGAALRMQAPPPTEDLVAYFSGAVEVGADGRARTGFTLPSFNGTVRLMAVAWSKSAIGQARAEVLVRDPVVVTASVPRFMAPGDESRLLLEIVHATGPAGRMGLDVTATGLTLGAVPSGIDLAPGGKAEVRIPLTAEAAEGTGTIRVALTTPDGRQLVKELRLPVESNDPVVSRQSRFDLAAGDSITLDANVFAGMVPGTGRATVAVGPIARFDAPGLLASLDRYPYGCTEQITSKALPLLYFGEVAQAVGVADEAGIAKRIDDSITAVLLNQAPNGAFGLWYPDSGDFWLDAYVTDFLSRAKAAGHAVPETAFRNALDNLRNQINYAPDFDSGGGPIAYALMVLAREGAAAIGDLRYYADVKGDAFDTPIAAAQLGAALASYGEQTRADAMFRRAAAMIAAGSLSATEAQVLRADYGTGLRDATALLALAAEAGSQAIDSDGLGEAVASRMAGRYLSTQEQTWALLATHALIDRPGAEGFTVNGAPVGGPVVRVLEDQAAVPQVITNGSGRPAVLTLTTFGVPAEPEPAGGNGYTITRSWYTLDGAPADPASVRQGTRLVAVVEVTPHAGGEARLMVDDPLPAGFEIDNPNLIAGGDIAALDWLSATTDTRNVEFRQDRFLAAIDWSGSTPFRLAYIVRAVSPGSFHLPAASVEDMYRPEFRARSAAGRVTVTE